MTDVGKVSGALLQKVIDDGLALVRQTVATDREAGRVTRADALEVFADATEEYVRRLRNGFEALSR